MDISPNIFMENGHYNGVATIKWVFPQLQREYFFSNGVTTSKWISPQIFLWKMDITMESPQLSGSFPQLQREYFFLIFLMGSPHLSGHLPKYFYGKWTLQWSRHN